MAHVVAHELLGALDHSASGGLLGDGHSWVAPPGDLHAAPPRSPAGGMTKHSPAQERMDAPTSAEHPSPVDFTNPIERSPARLHADAPAAALLLSSADGAMERSTAHLHAELRALVGEFVEGNVDDNVPLAAQGLDSLAMLELRRRIEVRS